MKRVLVGILVGSLVLGAGALAMAGPFGPGPYRMAQAGGMGPGMMGGGPGGMGGGPRGMMGGGQGYGMGPGMMGQGFGPGSTGFTPPCWQAGGLTQAGQPVSKEIATQILQSYVARTGNPNLKLGEIAETDTAFEGKIVTKDGSLVQKLVVEKATGRVYPVF